MAQTIKELPTFLITLQKSRMLLPELSVAEIIPYEPLQRSQDTPDWYLGILGWRGLEVPVISFEMLTDERANFSLISVASASLVICTGITASSDLPFFALIAQVMPELKKVIPDELIETGEETNATELQQILYKGDPAIIPAIDYIEQKLAEVEA
jgi:chemosensory pili system protein ChpC|tara:strand:+ start:1182 stop:1646 length:465 start_codon:yes stop_codon:yes gene_type:complete